MFNDIKKRITGLRASGLSQYDMDPRKDWKFLVALLFMAVLVVFLIDYIVLATAVRGLGGTDSVPAPAVVSINRAKMLNTLEVWKKKEAEFNALLEANPDTLIDPSS